MSDTPNPAAPAADAANPAAAPAPVAPAANSSDAPPNPAAAAPAAPAADAAAPKGPDNALSNPDTPAAPATWPEKWREEYAGEDKKLLDQLARYASPKAALDALFAAKARISKGDLQKVLGPNPTEADIKEYRAANGIPEEATGYKVELADGRVLGDADKPIVNEFLKDMHAKNMSPEAVNTALNSYFKLEDMAIQQREKQDATTKASCLDVLNKEFGGEFRRNINMANATIDQMFGGAADAFRNARDGNGVPLLNNPDIVRSIVNMAREMNPAAAVVPAAGTNAGNAIADEIKKFNEIIADPEKSVAYYRDEAAQARYRDLLDAQSKMEKRAA